MHEQKQPASEPLASFAVGKAVGQGDAFALVAGRCSAAQAEALLRIREQKLYLELSPTWKRFCPEFLNMSASQVDRIIRLWHEFGPAFFELRQLVRISPDFFRSIEPSVRDGALHFHDEAIEIDPVNAHKVASAVAEMRRALPAREKGAPTLEELLDDLDDRCVNLVVEVEEFARRGFPGSTGERFGDILGRASKALRDIALHRRP